MMKQRLPAALSWSWSIGATNSPQCTKKSDTIYARPNIDGLQSRLLAFQLAGPEFARAAFEDMRRNGIARRYRKFSNDALLFDEICEVG